MAEPGYALSKDLILNMGRSYDNIGYVRNVFSGKEKDIHPVRLRYWKEHVYGPNDLYPDLHLTLTDKTEITNAMKNIAMKHGIKLPEGNSAYEKWFGVKNLKTGTTTLRGEKDTTLKEVLEKSGPGIYLVTACRPSGRHSLTTSHNQAMKMYNTVKGRRMPPVSPRFPLNATAQRIEQNQARLAARKRARSSPARTYAANRPPARTYANVVAGRKKNAPVRARPTKRVNVGTRPKTAAVFSRPRINVPKNNREATLTKNIAAQLKKIENNMKKANEAAAERARKQYEEYKQKKNNSNNNLYQ
jgi:hypothetical protein